MYRKQLDYLNQWIQKTNRKPLVLRGARQVGKSTLVRLFADQLQWLLAEINLERHQDLASSFQRADPHSIINLLEMLPGVAPIFQI